MGGWIETRGDVHRVRTRAGGHAVTVSTHRTREDAETMLRGLATLRTDDAVSPVETLATLGARWLDMRERQGLRATASARSRWRCHVEPHPIARMPAEDIARRDVRRWLADLEQTCPHWATRKAVLDLVRGCLAWARLDELVHVDACEGLTVSRPADAHEQDGWTYLLPDEQSALLTRAPAELRPCVLIVAFALGTGLRQGEQWNLHLRDVHLDGPSPWLLVRWGSQGKPPKSGKMRRVPIFGIALAGLREWLALLPSYAPHNPRGLVFPTPRGCVRQRSKTPDGWPALLRLLGPDAHRHDGHGVRWHDLRHSCASSLVAGWWGRPWRLEEVREVLGHASITTTERYAHMAPGVLDVAAGATSGGDLGSTGLLPVIPILSESSPESSTIPGRATHDSNMRPLPSESGDIASDLTELTRLGGAAREHEEQILRDVASRSRLARRHAVELAEASKAYREAVERLLAAGAAPALRLVGGAR